jgi:hypothetical protein
MSVLVGIERFAVATIVLKLICPLSLPDDWVKSFAQHFACGRIDKVQASARWRAGGQGSGSQIRLWLEATHEAVWNIPAKSGELRRGRCRQ